MDRLMTLEDLAEYLQLKKTVVVKMVQECGIPTIRVANQWRFRKEEIDEWLNGQRSDYLE